MSNEIIAVIIFLVSILLIALSSWISSLIDFIDRKRQKINQNKQETDEKVDN